MGINLKTLLSSLRTLAFLHYINIWTSWNTKPKPPPKGFIMLEQLFQASFCGGKYCSHWEKFLYLGQSVYIVLLSSKWASQRFVFLRSYISTFPKYTFEMNRLKSCEFTLVGWRELESSQEKVKIIVFFLLKTEGELPYRECSKSSS